MLEYSFEQSFIDNGFNVVAGTDEAGRGPLAGPVVAAACVLPAGLYIEGLNDSKKLTEKKRDVIFDIIRKEAITYAIGVSSVEEIEDMNILNASMLAMHRAVEGLALTPDVVLVDGNIARGFPMKAIPIIKGDALSPSIAAASILAKVTRDRMCIEYDSLYPEYGFAKHKGYATNLHRINILKYGILPIHRKSFISFTGKKNENYK